MAIKGVIRGIKNELYQYDEGERLVRELTANDSTPPSTQNQIKLKLLLNKGPQFQTIVRMLFKRLRDFDNLRHVEKALIVIEYLLKHAERKFVRYCQMEMKTISKLARYRYMLNGRDYGGLIRKRAKRITAYLKDDDKLKEARAKAQGYAMSYAAKDSNKKSSYSTPKYSPYSNSRSSRPYNKESTKTSSFNSTSSTNSNKKSSKNIKPSKAKKDKKKKKEKKRKSITKDPELNKPMEKDEDLFAAFVGANNTTTNNDTTFNDDDFGGNNDFFDQIDNNQQQDNGIDDLLSANFWQNENDEGAKDEFDWYKADETLNELDSDHGKGDDGGEFGFAKEDDDDDNDNDNFFDENAEQKENEDELNNMMTSMVNLDNVLQSSSSKPKNLKNKKGKTMNQMKSTNTINVDPNFVSNINNSFNNNVNNNSYNNVSNPVGISQANPNDLFGNNFNTNNKPNNSTGNMFGQQYNQQPQQQQNIGFQQFYQPKPQYNNQNTYSSFNNQYGNGPVPATIPAKGTNKNKDPFAQFGFN